MNEYLKIIKYPELFPNYVQIHNSNYIRFIPLIKNALISFSFSLMLTVVTQSSGLSAD